MDRKISVLYVDDEIINIMNIEYMFKDYDFYFATNVNKAMELIDSKHPDIIFSDQKMPGKTGTEMFYEIREKYSDIVKVIVTGYIDDDDVKRSLQEDVVKKVFYKPVNPLILINFVKEMLIGSHKN